MIGTDQSSYPTSSLREFFLKATTRQPSRKPPSPQFRAPQPCQLSSRIRHAVLTSYLGRSISWSLRSSAALHLVDSADRGTAWAEPKPLGTIAAAAFDVHVRTAIHQAVMVTYVRPPVPRTSCVVGTWKSSLVVPIYILHREKPRSACTKYYVSHATLPCILCTRKSV